MCWSSPENVAYELVPDLPAMPSKSGTPYLDGLLDKSLVAVQPLFCTV